MDESSYKGGNFGVYFYHLGLEFRFTDKGLLKNPKEDL